MRIGELARQAKCSTQTIRFYEKAGLLPPPARTPANYRRYGSRHLDRLRFIRNCRSLDMTHEEIRALLGFIDQAEPDCSPVNGLLDEHIEHVNVRLAELTRLREQLTALRQCCHTAQDIPNCGIIRGLSSMQPVEQTAGSHLG